MKLNFSIFKNERKEKENQPDYTISMKNPDEEAEKKYLTVGGCWIKEGAKGKYFSCSIDDEYKKPEATVSDETEIPF